MRINSIHKDIKKFTDNLDEKVQAEVVNALDLLEEKGYEIRMPYSKKINKYIYEFEII